MTVDESGGQADLQVASSSEEEEAVGEVEMEVAAVARVPGIGDGEAYTITDDEETVGDGKYKALDKHLKVPKGTFPSKGVFIACGFVLLQIHV
jgi:hypothetical protein